MDRVHSRSGLLITGLIEMACSGLAALSLSYAVGWKVDLVPW